MTTKLKIALIISGALFILLLAALFMGVRFFRAELNRPNSLSQPKIIEITEGKSDKEIGAYLRSEGVIGNERVFRVAVLLFRKNMHSGFYEITAGMTMAEVLNLIDGKKVKIMKITFPEGWRAEQMGQRLAENKIVGLAEFMAAAKGKEGKLFPDTYFFNPKMDGSEIVEMMLDNFSRRTAALKLSDSDIIIASIIEREAVTDTERPVIAGIFANRLKVKMRLEADPTVQFGRDELAIAKLTGDEVEDFKFWQPITTALLTTVQSEYNTYLIPGLPPKPICNPGLKSLEAAAAPQKHDYYYFLHKNGQIYPSKTLEEHNEKRVSILGARL